MKRVIERIESREGTWKEDMKSPQSTKITHSYKHQLILLFICFFRPVEVSNAQRRIQTWVSEGAKYLSFTLGVVQIENNKTLLAGGGGLGFRYGA